MSDERLRELERRWNESGSVEDESVYLLERVRSGHLTKERLDLAAYLGHPAARTASDKPLVPARRKFGSRVAESVALGDWIRGLFAWGGEVAVLALIVVGRRLMIEYQPPYPAPVPEKLKALEEWARCPCDDHLGAVRRIAIWLNEEEGAEAGAAWTAHQVSLASSCLADGTPDSARRHVFRALWPLTTSTLEPQDLRPMIRDTLVPWALETEPTTG